MSIGMLERLQAAAVAQVAVCSAFAVCLSPGAFAEQGPAILATMAATEDSVTFGMLEARFDLTDAWLFSIGGANLDPGSARDEAQLRLSATGTVSFGSWSLENRNLLTLSATSVERYRMRLRAVRPRLFGSRALSLRAFDEVFFDFDSGRLFRNNVAAGFGIRVTEALSGELYHVWEMNRSSGDDSYVLGLMTFRFGVRGGD